MNKLLIPLALTLCLLLTGCIIGSPKVLKPMASHPGTEAVRIPSGTLALARHSSGDESDVLKHLKSVEVVSCEDPDNLEELESEFQDLVKKRKFELLIEADEPGETVRIYVTTDRSGDVIKELLIRSAEKDEHNFVYLKGKFKLSELLETETKTLSKW